MGYEARDLLLSLPLAAALGLLLIAVKRGLDWLATRYPPQE